MKKRDIKKLINFISVFIILSLLLSGCNFMKVRYTSDDTPRPVKEYKIKLYPAPVNTQNGLKWGYIDNSGNFILKATYDSANAFSDNNRAVVSKGGLFGIIDSSGKYIVPPKYEFINDYQEGRAIASDKSGYKILNEEGKVIFESNGYISPYKNGFAIAEKYEGGKSTYGYIDKEGKIAIPLQYEYANEFVGDRALVKVSENNYALIDRNGQTLYKYEQFYVSNYGEKMLVYRSSKDSKLGYIKENGSVAIKPKYDIASTFKANGAIVGNWDNYNPKYGVIDKSGRYIIPAEYSEINYLGEGLYALGIPLDEKMYFKGSKYAIADYTGKILTGFDYYNVGTFENGLASATNNTSTFFIDTTGKVSSTFPKISGVGTLEQMGDVVRVTIDRRDSYYTRDGKLIWEYNPTVKLNDRYSITEVKFKPNINYTVFYPQIIGIENESVQASVNEKLKNVSINPDIKETDILEYSYDADWASEFFRKQLSVIELNSYNYPFGAAHGMPGLVYKHIDLQTGRFYQLKDLFKKNSNYVKKLSDIIEKQIKSQGSNSSVWLDSYKGIKEDQPFYISAETLNIYFLPYEIAPYAAGFPTFKIPYKEIMDIIDTEGQFWKSFNY